MIIFVNWQQQRILTEKEMVKEIQEKAKHTFEDEGEFSEWLNDNFSASEVFLFDDEERLKIANQWKEECYQTEKELADYYWYEYEFEEDDSDWED
jgi:hypothetical protein